LAKTYDLPGRLVKVTPYRDDKTDGKVVEYYPSTEREKKVIPFRQGKVHGLVLEYYEDGTRKHELPALDDHFHGVEKEYDEKGQLIRTRYWLDDELVTKEDYVKGQTK
jgi:antitoxin component YwqK of YwqJK toxin-antitoxin module